MTTTRACRAPTHPPVALLVTSDAALRQQITDLASDQHLTITTVPRGHDLRYAWSTSPLVLLGVDRLPACRHAGLPPRPGVIVVAGAAPPDPHTLRRDAEALGARHLAVLPAAWTWLADQLAHPLPPAQPGDRSAHPTRHPTRSPVEPSPTPRKEH